MPSLLKLLPSLRLLTIVPIAAIGSLVAAGPAAAAPQELEGDRARHDRRRHRHRRIGRQRGPGNRGPWIRPSPCHQCSAMRLGPLSCPKVQHPRQPSRVAADRR